MTTNAIAVGIDVGASNVKITILKGERPLLTLIRELSGPTAQIVTQLLREASEQLSIEGPVLLGVTGVGRDIFGETENTFGINEVMAAAHAVAMQVPSAKTVIDMGGEFTKWIQLDDEANVADFATNGLCAAGAGAFLEQQAGRLMLRVQELGDLAGAAAKGATIAGRCSVFAKSDMIHLQQKGTPVDEIAYGLCLALIRTFSATVLQGRTLQTPVALAGGGAANKGLVRAVREIFALDENQLIIAPNPQTSCAFGAAQLASAELPNFEAIYELIVDQRELDAKRHTVKLLPLTPQRVPIEEGIEQPTLATRPKRAWLGMDVGSVSTNLVLLDEELNVLHGIYLPTKGRPVEVITAGLKEIADTFGEDLEILGCGTTGSGRHLAASLVGADVVKNEITAQMVSSAHYFPHADTIFEIGGQDSKYITMKNGQLTDFEMNKICAAGTGSFLEEQAKRLGINIIGEFGELALTGDDPTDLGSQCTVFMDSELVAARRRGSDLPNLCSGLAYSVVRNYLEKVVAHRPVGDHVVFQGGTASNKAVVAAFEKQLGRPVHVHPYNRISGAIGMALIAQRTSTGRSCFRGFASHLEVKVLTFECKSCSNRCQVSKLQIGDERAWFGDACDKFANKSQGAAAYNASNDADNIRETLLRSQLPVTAPGTGNPRIGLVTGSLSREFLPLWANLLHDLGYEVVYPEPTGAEILRRGVKHVPSEVCMPLKIAAGQVDHLINEQHVSKVFIPSVTEIPGKQARSSGTKNLPEKDLAHSCIFTQQLPFMVQRVWGSDTVLAPALTLEHYAGGYTEAITAISRALDRPFKEVKTAFTAALEKYVNFVTARRAVGRSMMNARDGAAIVLMGKPYNMYDPYVNMGLIRHFSKLGHKVIPLDFLPIDEVVLDEGSSRLPWGFNRDFIRTARFVADHHDLYPVMVSNFGCGPDAFTHKHLETILTDRPFLSLEFDEQRGEAGMVTRIEAFLDEIEHYETEQRQKQQVPPAPVFSRAKKSIRRIFIPWFGPHSVVYTGLFKSLRDMDVVQMPPPDMESIRLGEEVSSGRECHPYTIIAGDILRLLRDYRPVQGDGIYFMSTINPCLLAQYGDGYRLIVRNAETPLEILDLQASELWDILGFGRLRLLMEGLASIDALITLRHRFRPYEPAEGLVDTIIDDTIGGVEKALSRQRSPLQALALGLNRLREVNFGSYVRRPVVGLTGDLYTRLVDSANGNLIQRLEEMGCEVHHSPYMAGLLEFSNYADAYRWAARAEVKPVLWETLAMFGTETMMRELRDVLGSDYGPICLEPEYDDVITGISRYVGENSNYLVSSSIGKFIDFAHRGVDGVVNAIGINCMVGIAAGSAMESVRRDYNNVPMITLAYGGEEGVVQRLKLETFVHQVKEHWSNRGGGVKPMGLLADK